MSSRAAALRPKQALLALLDGEVVTLLRVDHRSDVVDAVQTRQRMSDLLAEAQRSFQHCAFPETRVGAWPDAAVDLVDELEASQVRATDDAGDRGGRRSHDDA